MLLKFYKIIAACAQNFIQITLFWDRKEGSSLLCSALKRDDLFFAGVALNEGVLFCISRFGGLGLAADHVLKAIACRGLLRRLYQRARFALRAGIG